ncbi:MAG: type II toxin-antitoxin system HicB family antitoxin [Thalassobaculum sp.]|uniref:type II toxin-antitoxin system HicB family antitoxin n=1 Tax=Thalassobaculum sp. TaxID=2022740 RepID=UPI0032EE8348
MLRYPIDLTPDDNGTFLVTCPDLPEVTTFGEDVETAAARASGAIEEALAARAATGQEIPRPSVLGPHSAAVGTQVEVKILLHRRLRAAGLTRADLQRRLGWQRESVDRLFRFDHASRLDRVDAALRAMGEEMRVETRAV